MHTLYAIYHLARKPSGRTAGSSAFYMTFASLVDLSILPFYAYGALVAHTRSSAWGTILSDAVPVFTFTETVFLTSVASGGLHILSILIAIYLAITFRKITRLPPDMNPLEDNLTSRHKRNKSSISTMTTVSDKRLSDPLEAKRSSGAPYEDLSRPPTIPFFHTRTQSTSSFSTYKSTQAPGSSDGQENDFDFSSNVSSNRRYQPVPNPSSPSLVDQKRSSRSSSPLKRAAYQEVPLSDLGEMPLSQNQSRTQSPSKDWYASDSFSKPRPRTPGKQNTPPNKSYKAGHQRYDSSDNDLSSLTHPNPLSSNPSTPTPPKHGHRYTKSYNSPLSEIQNTNAHNRNSLRNISGDITNINLTSELLSSHQSLQSSTQAPIHPYRQPPTRSPTRSRYVEPDAMSFTAHSVSAYSDDEETGTTAKELVPAPLRSSTSSSTIGKAVSTEMLRDPISRQPISNVRDLIEKREQSQSLTKPPQHGTQASLISPYTTNPSSPTKTTTNTNSNSNTVDLHSPTPTRAKSLRYGDAADTSELNMKSKSYRSLKPGTPPIMVGPGVPGFWTGGEDKSVVVGGGRQVSGNDFAYLVGGGRKGREVSGKLAEEGRGNFRNRKVSGM